MDHKLMFTYRANVVLLKGNTLISDWIPGAYLHFQEITPDIWILNSTMESPKVCAMLPAAGIGSRMNATVEKQFACVLKRPIISYTMTAFEEMSEVVAIVVIVQPSKYAEMMGVIQKFGHKKVALAVGSTSRHKSILNGLKTVKKMYSSKELDVIVVHDGVRPLVEREDISSVIRAAFQYGAAAVVTPLVSTPLKAGPAGFLERALNRDEHRASETPQACLYQLMWQAYEKCSEYDLEHGTECLDLLQKYAGTKAKLVDGPGRAWKITYKEDLETFENAVRSRQWKRGAVIFHTSDDRHLIERFRECLRPLSEDVVIVNCDDGQATESPLEAGTLLFLGDVNSSVICNDSLECQRGCCEQVDSSEGRRSYLSGVLSISHSIISKGDYLHKRICMMSLFPQQDVALVVDSAKILHRQLGILHDGDCNVTVNAAVFMDGKEVSPAEIKQFLKELHFMPPGRTHIY